MSVADDILKLSHEIYPFRIGSRVRVNSEHKYAADWGDTYAVVGITWDYQRGVGNGINIAIASDRDILARYGSTDGFSPDDLIPVGRRVLKHQL
jgi:hypothetical protein